jgi:hypothetical protein
MRCRNGWGNAGMAERNIAPAEVFVRVIWFTGEEQRAQY